MLILSSPHISFSSWQRRLAAIRRQLAVRLGGGAAGARNTAIEARTAGCTGTGAQSEQPAVNQCE